MQQSQPRYHLGRRVLFPYSGEEVLTTRQMLRVITAWVLTFPSSMALLTLFVAILNNLTWQKSLLLILAAFCFGALAFGSLAWLSVTITNQSARIRLQLLAAKTNNPSGGSYGS